MRNNSLLMRIARLLLFTVFLTACGSGITANVALRESNGAGVHSLELARQPLNRDAGQSQEILVVAKDEAGALAQHSSAKVYLELVENSEPSAKLTGGEPRALTNGQADFVISVDRVGAYKLRAKLEGLGTSAESSEFAISAHPPRVPANPILINDGAAYTSASTISLKFQAEDASRVKFGLGADCGGSWAKRLEWQAYQNQASFALAPNERNKLIVISAQFQNAAGVSSECYSDSIIHDDNAPDAPVLGVGSTGFNSDFSVSVGYAGAAPADFGAFRYSFDGPVADCRSGTELAGGSISVTGTANRILNVVACDLADNISTPASATYSFDNSAPSNILIQINADATYSKSQSVQLTLAATDVSPIEMHIGNTSQGCSDGEDWESFTPSKPWNLAGSQLNQTAEVFVKFRDILGNVSACISDSIIHDNAAPLAPSIVPSSRSFSTDFTVSISQNASPASDHAGFRYKFGSAPTDCSDGLEYNTPLTITAGITQSLFAISCDNAGNHSAATSALYEFDAAGPDNGSILIDGGAAYTGDTTVSLALSADAATHMLVVSTSNDCINEDSDDWVAYSPSAFSYSLASANASNTLYAKFKDAAGNESSCYSASIVHDNTPPGTPSIDTEDRSFNSAFSVSVSQHATVDLTHKNFRYAFGSAPANCTDSGTTTAGPITISGTSTVTLYVVACDHLNQISASPAIKTYTYDATPPSAPSISISVDYTISPTVNLALSAGGDPDEMYITNTADCVGGGNWQDYQSSVTAWAHGASNSEARVYVKFRDATNNESACVFDSVTHDTTSPLTPNLSYASQDFTSDFDVTVTENATVDANFKEFRYAFGSAPGSCSNGTATLGIINVTGVSDRDLYVIACDHAGNASSTPASANYRYTGAPSASPSAPAFENITKSSVRINWDDVDYDTGYVVERGAFSGGNCSSITPTAVTLAVNSPNTLSVNDTASPSLVAGTPYCYRVKATGQTSDSAFSNWAVVITESDAPSILSQTTSSITTNWSNVAGVSYRLYRSTSTQSVSTSDSLVSGSALPTVADNSASCGNPNYYALLPEISGASSLISEGSAAGYCKASSPSISPAEGSYSSAQTATISTSLSGASTCYTTDGSAPTLAAVCQSSGTTLCNVGDSTPYISSTTEIKAISCKSNYANSDAVSHNFTIMRGNPAVYTINATTAYMVGTSGTIKRTTDSGSNWTTVTSPTSNDLTGIYCSSTTSCVVSGFGGVIYTTTNFTSSPPTWTLRAVSGVTANLTAMHFTTSSYGVIVGYGGTVLTTSNGGTTWTNRTSAGVATEDLFGAYAASTSIFYAVGASGAVLKSTNFSSFTKSTISGNPTLRGVSAMSNGSHVYIVGDNATILYSSNSGSSYSDQSAPSGFTHHLYAVDCQGPELCFAAGSGGNMITTSNNGTTWSAISSGTVSSIYSLSIRPTTGAYYAAGTSSADDGRSTLRLQKWDLKSPETLVAQ